MPAIDGFLAPVPDQNRDSFIAHAREMAAVFKEYGATEVVDALGTEVPDGELTSMPLAVKAEPGETIAFGWIIWPDEAARKAGWEKAMADPRMQNGAMPFDGKRLIFGTFEMVQQS